MSDALSARLDAVTRQHAAVSEADQLLADAVTAAHAITVSALERLGRIETEIETAAAAPAEFAPDSPAGALEFQRFLLSKQREIVAVVSEASDQAAAKTAVLQQLMDSYRAPRN